MEHKTLWLLFALTTYKLLNASSSSSDSAQSIDDDDMNDSIDDGSDECLTLCPCFTSLDITEACMSSNPCTLTDSVPIQREVTCDNNTFAVLPFTNECVRNEQDPVNLNEDELSICSSILSVSAAIFECDTNEATSCPLDRQFTESTILDPIEDFDAVDIATRPAAITSTIPVDIDPADVEGLTLVDIVISVAIEHTRIGDVLATLSHDAITDHPLFGNDVTSSSHCGSDDIFVTITDSADLPSADLIACTDGEGNPLNGGEALGFGRQGGLIGFGGTRLPLQALSVFIDQDVNNINGDWNLRVSDDTDGNIGYFGAWEITFVYRNEQVQEICESELNARQSCCDLTDENGILCDATKAYCQSAACLIARDNADNLETIIQSMFEVIDLRCSGEE